MTIFFFRSVAQRSRPQWKRNVLAPFIHRRSVGSFVSGPYICNQERVFHITCRKSYRYLDDASRAFFQVHTSNVMVTLRGNGQIGGRNSLLLVMGFTNYRYSPKSITTVIWCVTSFFRSIGPKSQGDMLIMCESKSVLAYVQISLGISFLNLLTMCIGISLKTNVLNTGTMAVDLFKICKTNSVRIPGQFHPTLFKVAYNVYGDTVIYVRFVRNSQ